MLLLVSAGNIPGQNYRFSNWTATTFPSPDACEATTRVKTRIQLNIPLITAQYVLLRAATQKVFFFQKVLKASETSKGRVKLKAWLSPLKQGHNPVLKASLLNTSLKYSFSLSSCILLFKEDLKAKRELRRRLSGKSNKGLNSLCFHPNPHGQGQSTPGWFLQFHQLIQARVGEEKRRRFAWCCKRGMRQEQHRPTHNELQNLNIFYKLRTHFAESSNSYFWLYGRHVGRAQRKTPSAAAAH